MIKSIEITNLQSHDHTILNFCKSTNAITGPSDSGKSAIFRAFGFVMNNDPNNVDDLLSNWCKDTDEVKVKIETYEGNIIERIRSKTKNMYVLNSQELKGFGQNVPDAVQKILNISELNFQTQYQMPFLLSYSPPEISRFINKLIDLEDIDIFYSEVERDKRDVISSLKAWKKQLELETIKLEQYSYLENIQKEHLQVKEIYDRIEYIKAWMTSLINLMARISELKSKKRNLSKILIQKNEIENCLSSIESINNILFKKEQIEKRINLIQVLSNKIYILSLEKKKYKQILKYNLEIKKLNEIHNNIEQKIIEIKQKIKELEQIETLSGKIKRLLIQKDEITKQKISFEKEINILLIENEIKCCPFCGAVLKIGNNCEC